MSWMKLPFTAGGQFVSGAAMVAIFAAGCGGPWVTDGELFGTIVNTDISKDLIGGVRLRTEEAVYAFGTFQPNGAVGQITSGVYRDRGGRTATLYLESGRPSRAIGFDGSRLEIVYHEVSAAWLRGEVAFTPAGGQSQTYAFEVDLQKTAQEVAELVEQLAGVQIIQEPPPADPGTADKSIATADRQDPAGPMVAGVFVLAVPVVLVITGFTLNLVLSQILHSMLRLGDALVKSVVVTVLTPFILMGNLMRMAAGQPLVTLEYNERFIGADDVVLTIPRPQPF